MLKTKRDINQEDIAIIIDLRFVKFEWFSLTWSGQPDTTSSEWKFQLNTLVFKGLM